MKGVEKVEVDFPKKIATIQMKKNAKFGLRKGVVEKALEKNGGFKVASFEAKKVSKKKVG